MKKKIFIVLGTRPEIIRLSRIINIFDKYFSNILINTNQNFTKELNSFFFKDLEIRQPDYQLKIKKEFGIDGICIILKEFEKILIKEKPDALFILGDTNSALVSYVAKRHKVPIFHYEAGNRSFDQRVPEEINRKIVDHLADINLTYSSRARDFLINEGFDQNRVFNIGSPLGEVIDYYKNKIHSSKIMNKYNLTKKKFFLISFHRDENLNNKLIFNNFFKLLTNLEKKYRIPIIISTHPRLKEKIKNKMTKKVIFSKPFTFTDYCNLQINSFITLSDSGTISEEASLMGIKAINLRQVQERHEAMDSAIVPLFDLSKNFDTSIINIVKKMSIPEKIEPYTKKNIAEKILKIVISYIDYVNSNIWKK